MTTALDFSAHFQAFKEVIFLLTRHRQLTLEMARREITDKYLGQVFGLLWILGHPLVLMAVYIFVFSFVFKMRLGGTPDMPFNYTIYLLSGLIPWLGFQEVLSKSSAVILTNANLVKQVVFPVEILPVRGVISSTVTMAVLFAMFTIYVLVSYLSLPVTYALLPVLLAFQVLAMIGASYALSSVGVYFRDLKDFVLVHNMVGIYLMPIFYLPEQVPRLFMPFLFLNPFSHLVWCYQDALYFGRFAHWWAWIAFPVLSIVLFCVGYRVFRKLKNMFGNIL